MKINRQHYCYICFHLLFVKRYRSIFLVLSAILLLAGCHSSNKGVSTFGKRKYTKGYYCFSTTLPYKRTAEVKKTSIPLQKIETANTLILNHIKASPKLALFSAYPHPIPSPLHISKTIDKLHSITSVERKISEPDGIPGHGNLPHKDKGPNTTYCGLWGFIFSISGPVVGIALSSFIVFGLFFVMSLALSIIGLSIISEPHRGFATAGLVIDISTVVLIGYVIFLLLVL